MPVLPEEISLRRSVPAAAACRAALRNKAVQQRERLLRAAWKKGKGYRKHTMRLIQEFKNFALKGNVVDMAVGVVVGGAFSKVVSSIVTDLITPVIGMLTAARCSAENACWSPKLISALKPNANEPAFW